MLLAVVGGAIDYSRALSHQSKLRANTEMAVAIANQEAKSSVRKLEIATDFLKANMPDAKLKTRRSLVDGNVVLQVQSEFDTPVLSMIGKPNVKLTVTANMPDRYGGGTGRLKVKLSDKQLGRLRKKLDRMIAKAPPKYRAHYKREYDLYYQRLKGR